MLGKVYQTANFILDTKTKRFFQQNRLIPISSRAFDILEYLIKNQGKVVKKSELLETVWADCFVEESNLPVHISALRRILGERRGESRFIKTIPGRGYCFIAPVQELDPISELTTNQQRKSADHEKLCEPLSLAVLPFTFDLINADFEYLADGITLSLINDLSEIANLKVIAYTAVRNYRQTSLDLQEIGFLLGANRILTGHITGYKNELEITVELIDTNDKSHLWGVQELFQWDNIFRVKKQISIATAEKLKHKLTQSDKNVFSRYEPNPEAQKLYFRGKFMLEARITKTNIKHSLMLASGYFQQAIEKDSKYALAYTGLGGVYISLHSNQLCHPREAHAEIQKALQTALRLDDQLSQTFVLKGMSEIIFERQYEKAEESFDRAIELNSNNADAYHCQSHLNLILGKFDIALAMENKAIQFDPISLLFSEHLIRISFFSGDYDRVIVEAQELLEFEKNCVAARLFMALSYAHLGFAEQSLASIEKAVETRPSSEILLMKAYILALTNDKIQAEKIISDVLLRFSEDQTDPADLAYVYSALGQVETAFHFLEKAFEISSTILNLLKVEKRVEKLRHDQRLNLLLKRLCLS